MGTHVSRRQLAKGVAWSMPVLVSSAVVPAYAASTGFTGLNGWIKFTKTCSSSTDAYTLTINGIGVYPSRGLWVEGGKSSTRVENTRITYYYPSSLGNISWQAGAENNGWSVPAYDGSAPEISGYFAYTSTYQGGWTYDSTNSILLANGQPMFTATASSSTGSCDKITFHVRRSVDIDGRNYLINRGPVTL